MPVYTLITCPDSQRGMLAAYQRKMSSDQKTRLWTLYRPEWSYAVARFRTGSDINQTHLRVVSAWLSTHYGKGAPVFFQLAEARVLDIWVPAALWEKSPLPAQVEEPADRNVAV